MMQVVVLCLVLDLWSGRALSLLGQHHGGGGGNSGLLGGLHAFWPQDSSFFPSSPPTHCSMGIHCAFLLLCDNKTQKVNADHCNMLLTLGTTPLGGWQRLDCQKEPFISKTDTLVLTSFLEEQVENS